MILSLVLPCFNEEATIERTVRDVVAWFRKANVEGEIIVVNDGSTDGSAAIVQALKRSFPSLTLLRHEHNLGYGSAVTTGLDAAQGDIIGFMDSDGQFRPEDFERLLPHLQRVEFVAGFRERRADPFFRSFFTILFQAVVRCVLGVTARDLNCGMKLMRRTLWPRIRPEFGTAGLFGAELYYRLMQSHIPWQQVPVPHYPRTAGKPSGAKLSVILRAFADLWHLKRSLRKSRWCS